MKSQLQFNNLAKANVATVVESKNLTFQFINKYK